MVTPLLVVVTVVKEKIGSVEVISDVVESDDVEEDVMVCDVVVLLNQPLNDGLTLSGV